MGDVASFESMAALCLAISFFPEEGNGHLVT